MSPLIWIAVALSVVLSLQAAYTLYIMLYTWDEPEAYERARAPERFRPPTLSFTVLLPARHEEEVIQHTIERVVRANYPAELIEALVICEAGDTGTIAKAEEKVAELAAQGWRNARVVTFSDGPINKPHGLNVGLRRSSNQVVTIFDAEDEIHPDIFNIVNTVMLDEG
ncbi:MAG TPA: glycosyltransferase, partial [Chloroflexota bacterium]